LDNFGNYRAFFLDHQSATGLNAADRHQLLDDDIFDNDTLIAARAIGGRGSQAHIERVGTVVAANGVVSGRGCAHGGLQREQALLRACGLGL
jgi:hypothetical protein